jgi:hypothetical protein
LIPREEVKNETDPLWSIKIKQQNLGICKDFNEEVILEANLFVSIKLQQYTSISICSTLGFIQ